MKAKKLLFPLLLFPLTLAGCAGGNGGEDDESIDKSKTQLYVWNVGGGYKSEWLKAAKTRFEELHKNDSYEEGKKGVQVMIKSEKLTGYSVMPIVNTNKETVYFAEFCMYYTMLDAGCLGDITDVVSTPLSEYGESRSIIDKLTDEQKAYYGIQEGGAPHYYAIPHYNGFTGLTYNVDLFEEKGYYFAKNRRGPNIEDQFVRGDIDTKDYGPDGLPNTSDDGLPATYDEFFLLCDYICGDGNVPINWTGKGSTDYPNFLLNALGVDALGLEKAMIQYSCNGVCDTLCNIDQNGNIVRDAEPTTITGDNGYEVLRQEERLHALEFYYNMINGNGGKYHGNKCFNTGYSQLDAQDDFLYSGHDGKTKPIAMLLDGIWWEMEASQTFNDMVSSKGENYSKQKRKFALMPYPKVDASHIGEKNTIFDHEYGMTFEKPGLTGVEKTLSDEFIRFTTSDESLIEFTMITDTPKAFNYTIPEDKLQQMSHYGRSVYEMTHNSDVVYPCVQTSLYANNQSTYFTCHKLWVSSANGATLNWASTAFHENKVASAKEFFSGMYRYGKAVWPSLKK